MTNKIFEELGWKFDYFWKGRAFYSLSKNSHFVIFEDDEWGLMDPFAKKFELIDCNLTNEEIENYTELAKSYEDIVKHPKDNSLYDYTIVVEKLNNFINEMKKRV